MIQDLERKVKRGEGLTENTVELKIVSPVTGVAIVRGAKEFESCCPVFAGGKMRRPFRTSLGSSWEGDSNAESSNSPPIRPRRYKAGDRRTSRCIFSRLPSPKSFLLFDSFSMSNKLAGRRTTCRHWME